MTKRFFFNHFSQFRLTKAKFLPNDKTPLIVSQKGSFLRQTKNLQQLKLEYY